jgi:GntR family transcriptional repressor for pyruvate dehydrogenase complex
MSSARPSTAYLHPVAHRRAFEEILFQLEEAIAAGHLGAGDRLPPERELATRFQVSRTSVREALRVLEALGLVRVRRGAENGAMLLEEPGNAISNLLRFYLALQHVSLASLIELRITLESWAAGAAARRSSPSDLGRAGELLEQMETEDLDELRYLETDLAFHIELARASGNDLVQLVLEGCRGAIWRTMLQATMTAGDWPVVRDSLRGQHRAILDAVLAGDDAAASRLVGEHIRPFYEDLLASLETR